VALLLRLERLHEHCEKEFLTRILRRQINEKEMIEGKPHIWCKNGVY